MYHRVYIGAPVRKSAILHNACTKKAFIELTQRMSALLSGDLDRKVSLRYRFMHPAATSACTTRYVNLRRRPSYSFLACQSVSDLLPLTSIHFEASFSFSVLIRSKFNPDGSTTLNVQYLPRFCLLAPQHIPEAFSNFHLLVCSLTCLIAHLAF